MKKLANLFVMFFLISCTPAAINIAEITATPVHFRLGYCPTMQGFLPDLFSQGLTFESVPYSSASNALQALIAGEVDAALIGRKPYAAEIDQSYVYKQLRNGVTLISNQQRLIPYADLATLSMHTTLDPENITGLFPDGMQIIHHSEPVTIDLLDQNSALLIDWKEVEGNYQLIIPVNEQGQKIRLFRTPFFVYASSETAKFQELISSISAGQSE